MYIKEYEQVLGYLAKQIKDTEFEGHVFAVGGCVRDSQIAKNNSKAGNIKDIDLVVDLPNGGIRFAEYLKSKNRTKGSLVIYETFGTVMFRLRCYPDIELEAVQTRSECYRDENSRKPETTFGTIEQDAFRRDFTINALYYDISNKKQIDFNGHGLEDLRNHIIDTCGDPDIIFDEDPLRIMRAVRFAAKLGYTISERTVEGIKKYAKRLDIISQERITDEFNKILVTGNPTYGLRKLQDFGIMEVIAPELCKSLTTEAMIDLSSLSYDLDCYNLYAEQADKPLYDKERMMLSMISYFTGPNDFEKIMHSMRYPYEEIKEVRLRGALLRSAFYSSVSDSLTILHVIEYKCKDMLEYEKFYFVMKRIREIPLWLCMHPSQEHPLIGYKLPVDGNWVMEKFNVKQGPRVGWILEYMLIHVFENPKGFTTQDDFLKIRNDILRDIADTKDSGNVHNRINEFSEFGI